MGCAGCTTCGTSDGKATGCKSNGCATGGCNRLNTYDWLSAMDVEDVQPFEAIEVSFKNGARKDFYYKPGYTHLSTGDMAVVDTGSGFDIGRVSLSGELVRLQMRKKNVPEDAVLNKVLRQAHERDLEKLKEVRDKEMQVMVRSRAIARSLKLDMKIGDVEFQADGRKATFYYTADGRVDFRELIRHFAREFKVKIEMRQIGARQESARIGGVGSCGRELCCSTWLTDFKSVTTAAARYQNLAINQAKLSGQCGRLKCCLNYELDTYMEAFEEFPKNAEKLITKAGKASLVKTDIFKRLMTYVLQKDSGRGKFYTLHIKEVKKILEMNRRGEYPPDLVLMQITTAISDTEQSFDFEDVTGEIELPEEKRKKNKKKRRRGRGRNRNQHKNKSKNKPNKKNNK